MFKATDAVSKETIDGYIDKKEDGMIRITSNNAGFGETIIEFKGKNDLEHVATYLHARSSSARWDRPYLGDFDTARSYIKENLSKDHACQILVCIGGGSMPDYERITVEYTVDDSTKGV